MVVYELKKELFSLQEELRGEEPAFAWLENKSVSLAWKK